MEFLAASIDVVCGWLVWSLGHNVGHRWWHAAMERGHDSIYAHGERQHHVIYDHDRRDEQRAVDPKEMFISFPLFLVGPAGLLFVAAYGYLFGRAHALPFAIGLYTFMLLDHQLHIAFHRRSNLPGVLGWFQKMHLIHHATHNRNFFFVSGMPWDVLFRTAVVRPSEMLVRPKAKAQTA